MTHHTRVPRVFASVIAGSPGRPSGTVPAISARVSRASDLPSVMRSCDARSSATAAMRALPVPCSTASSCSCPGPGRPDGVGGDDHLVGVIAGLDLLQAAVGGGREHYAGGGRRFFEVVVVVAGVPGGEGVLDRLRLRAHHAGQFGRGGEAAREHYVLGVDDGLGAAGGGAG